MPQSLEELEASVRRIDAKLRPIAKRRVDASDPNWFQEMTQGPAPIDRAGVRREAQELLASIIEDYARKDANWRAAVRGLLARYDSFLWATPLPMDAKTPRGLRAHLIRFAMSDQEKDPRDAKLTLDAVLKQAREAGVDAAPIVREVAALCGDGDPYGWGSTRQWLEKAAADFGMP